MYLFKRLLIIFGIALTSMNSLAASPTITQDLRIHALTAKAADFGIKAASLPGGVWGIVMDTQYPEGPATVVALADGSASLYLGNRSGIIGGGAHERVRVAAKAAVAAAAGQLHLLQPTTDFSLPKVNYTHIFALTSRGVYASGPIAEQVLGNNEHGLSPVFYAVQDVITALRLAAGDTK